MTRTQQPGFTLIEIIAVTGILSLIAVGIGALSFWGMRLWNITQDHIKAQETARTAFDIMAREIREMQISDNGSYAIENADHDTLIFYANIDDDDDREKIKYELQGGTMYRWTKKSTGDTPAVYSAFTDDDKTTIISQIINTDDFFQYYDDSYTGTSPALTEPVSISAVRLIKITALIDYDPSRTPDPLELITDISLRNLKDNL
ncbi:MAG: prepilin-type N-terminal cleavage/methylation domain-containing protein [Patescibacteria group bacterium]